MEAKRSIWGQLVILAMLLGAAGALWVGREQVGDVLAGFTKSDDGQRTEQPRAKRKVPVVVARAGRADDNVAIEAIATARAERSVTLYPEADGTIVYLGVNAGDRVKTGDVILELDADAAELAVELAKVRVTEAERQLDRSERLRRKNVNSDAKVDDARTVLERTRLELRQAQETLSYRTLRAPFEGIVGIRKVEAGDRATTTTAIITVDDRSNLIAEFEVAEQFLSRLATGQTVMARTPSFGDRKFEGTIDRLDTRIDPTSRTVMVRAALPNREDHLRPGMSFAVELAIPGRSYATVPELALQWSRGASYVWRITKGVAEKVAVRTVKRLNNQILVDGDIREGDLVVVEGVQRLRPGRAVRFSEPTSAPGS